MSLFALCINPLLQTLEQKLTGIRIGRREKRTTVIAYADDVTVIVTKPEDIAIIQETLKTYEAASGATVNMQKSRAIALGNWVTSLLVMDIPYSDETKILGFNIQNTVKATARKSWALTTARIRAQAQAEYLRALTLNNRIQFIHEYLLARVWYMTQIFPPPEKWVRQLNTTISWFLWKEEIFRVPLSTLQRTREEGGWDLLNPAAKCMALFLFRVREQGMKDGTLTAEWMRRLGLHERTTNPTSDKRTPRKLEHLHRYDMESAYVAPQGPLETQKAYKKRPYNTMHTIMSVSAGFKEMRVTRRWPQVNWINVWRNLRDAPVPESTRMAWYRVIHELIATNERLHKIHLTPTDSCRHCALKDTLEHRLAACGEGRDIWDYSKSLLAQILRTVPNWIL
jgi:hypothetical protein